MSGGYVPEASRGTISDAYVHVCDWYGALCTLAGAHDCEDSAGAALGVPAVDSVPGILVR